MDEEMINTRMLSLRPKNEKETGEERLSPLLLINEISNASAELAYSDSDMSDSEIKVLLEISSHEGRQQNDAVKSLRLNKATVSVIIKKLESNGFVRRETDVTDRRAVRIYLTDRGRSLVEKIRETEREAENIASRDLTTNEYEMLLKLLTKVRDNFVR